MRAARAARAAAPVSASVQFVRVSTPRTRTNCTLAGCGRGLA